MRSDLFHVIVVMGAGLAACSSSHQSEVPDATVDASIPDAQADAEIPPPEPDAALPCTWELDSGLPPCPAII